MLFATFQEVLGCQRISAVLVGKLSIPDNIEGLIWERFPRKEALQHVFCVLRVPAAILLRSAPLQPRDWSACFPSLD